MINAKYQTKSLSTETVEDLKIILQELQICIDEFNKAIETRQETSLCKKQYAELLKIAGVLNDILGE